MRFAAPRSLLWFVALPIAFAACGGDDPPVVSDSPDAGETPPPQRKVDAGVELEDGGSPPLQTEGSGSRFRMMHVLERWDDGSEIKTFAAFYDLQLYEVCFLAPVGGDSYACLPQFSQGEEGFADDACTKPIVAVSSLDEDELVRWGPPCAPKLGARAAPPLLQKEAQVYRRNQHTMACELSGERKTIMPVPTELPASMFGTFTRKIATAPFPGETSGSRLMLESERFESPDGAFEWRAPRIIDKTRQSSGTIDRGLDGQLHLFTFYGSVAETSGLWFSDAACTAGDVIAFGRDNRICNDPWRAQTGSQRLLREDGACFGIREITRPASPLAVAYNFLGTCKPDPQYPSPNGGDLFAAQLLSEVPYGDLATLTESYVPVAPAGAKMGTKLEMRARTYVSSDGLSLRAREATRWLREFDLPCHADYEGKCLPDAPYADDGGAVYADAACTDKLLMATVRCGEPIPTLVTTFVGGGSQAALRVPAAAIHSSPTVYSTANGGCESKAVTPGWIYIKRSLTEEATPSLALPKLVKRELPIDK